MRAVLSSFLASGRKRAPLPRGVPARPLSTGPIAIPAFPRPAFPRPSITRPSITRPSFATRPIAALVPLLALSTGCQPKEGEDVSFRIDAAGSESTQRFVIVRPASSDPGMAVAVDQFAALLDESTDLPISVVSDEDPVVLEPGTAVFALGPNSLSERVVPVSERQALKLEGYLIRRDEIDGAAVFAAVGRDTLGTQYAAYALLEALGFGFFHPAQTYIPEAPALPASLDQTWTPSYAWRGMHLHTMHPIELMDTLLVPSDEHLAEARRYIDWLVANRQDYFQWVLQDTIDLEAWLPHAAGIVEYAHRRGIRVGIDTPFEFIQQNGWVLVPHAGPWEPQITARLELLLEVPWDVINVELGSSEFIPSSDETTVEMLNFTSSHLMSAYGVELISKVHVSTGQTAPNYGDINFNFLPGVSDPLVGALPHSVQFYDLYRIAPTYDNEDFSHIREFLLEEIPERTVLYYPETAYWCSFDIDVPLYLPHYIFSRWHDLNELKDSGMDGQVNFSSGLEWGYWLHDWAAAGFSYEAGTLWSDYLTKFTRIFGDASSGMQALLEDVIREQGDDLLEDSLIAYVIGWDAADDLGHLVDTHAQPVKVLFPEVRRMTRDELEAFSADVMPRLQALEDRYDGFVTRIRDLEPQVPIRASSWYWEQRRGLEVLSLRIKHVRRLYEGTVLRTEQKLGMNPDGDVEAGGRFSEAQAFRREAEALIVAQEAVYRFPVERLARRRDNPTSYEYGYLYTASDAYFWRREELQAIDENTCVCLANLNNMVANLVGEGHPLEQLIFSLPELSDDCWDQCVHPIDRISDLGGSQ